MQDLIFNFKANQSTINCSHEKMECIDHADMTARSGFVKERYFRTFVGHNIGFGSFIK